MWTLQQAHEIETAFAAEMSERQSGDARAYVRSLTDKISDAKFLVEYLDRYKDLLPSCGRILELGGGQGWASCLYKKLNPDATVIYTDLAPGNLEQLPKWQRVWQIRIDHAYACPSYRTGEGDESVDLVFAFASAHHFRAQRRTLGEIFRVLKPGGVALYLYEPQCPSAWYGRQARHIQAVRPEVPEDVLDGPRLLRIAREIGFEATLDLVPFPVSDRLRSALASHVLIRYPILRKLLPCPANFIFRKPCG